MAKLLTGTRIYGSATVDTILFLNSTTNSASTNSGALQVIGGAGIGGNLYVGGTVNANSLVGVITTATNLAGGAAGSLPYQSAAGATTFLSIGSNNYVLTSNGSVPTWVSASTLVVGNATTSTNIAGGTAGQTPYQTAPGITSFYGPGTAGDVLVSQGTSGPTYQNTLTLAGTAQATSTQSGVLQVRGGAGIGLDLFVGNNLTAKSATITNATQSSNTSTGALTVTGGVGIGGNLYVDGTVNAVTFNGTATNSDNIKTVQRSVAASHYLTFVDSDNASAAYEALYTDAGISYNPNTNALTVTGDQTLGGDLAVNGGDITSSAATFNLVNSGVTTLNVAGAGTAITVGATTGYTSIRNATTITNASVSTSTNTGALVVYGGAGFGGDVYATGGQFDAVRVGITAANEIDTTAGDLILDSAGGTVSIDDNLIITGNLTVQGTTTIVDSTVTNVADPIFAIGTGPGGGNPASDDNKDRGIQFHWHNGTNARTGFFGYDDSTGFFTFLSSATFVNDVAAPSGGTTRGAVDVNLAYGSAGALVYQDAANSTAFLNLGSNGFVLTAGATAPQWTSLGSIAVGTAAAVDTVATATNAVHYLAFVNSNNASPSAELIYTTSTLQVNPATGNVAIGGTSAPPSKLTVTGNARISGITTVTDSTSVGSTATGALQVVGGVGIGGGLFVGGIVTATSFSAGNGGSNDIVITSSQISRIGGSVSITGGNNSVPSIAGGAGLTAGNNGPLDLYSGASGNINLRTSTYGQTVVVSSSATLSTLTGALQVVGGLGVGGGGFFGGTVTATSFVGSFLGNITGVATSATNLAGGAAGSIPIQSAAGATAFIPIGSAGFVLQSNGSTATWVNTSSIFSGFANTSTNLQGGTAGQIPYQSGVSATAFTGPGTAGQLLQSQGTSAPTYVSTASLHVQTSTYAINLLYGAAGSLPYQSAAGTTAMLAIGGNGLVLTSDGGVPTWATAGNATTATNIAGGTAGQVPYQTGAGLTSFYGPGTSGQLLISQGTSAPAYTNTSTFMVGRATSAINLLYGSTGSLHYQSSADTSAMLGIGTAGQVLTVNAGATAPQWVSTGTIYAGTAVNADNIRTLGITTNASYYPIFVDSNNASSAYEAAYSTVGISVNPSTNHFTAGGFIPTSTSLSSNGIYAGTSSSIIVGIGGQPRLTIDGSGSGFVRVDNALDATSTATGALRVIGGAGIGGNLYVGQNVYATTFVGTATTATNLAGGTAGQLPYQTGAGATSFTGPGTAGQLLRSQGTSAPTYVSTASLHVQTSTYTINLLNGAAGSLPYQGTTSSTAMLDIGSAGAILTVSAGLPAWTAQSNLTSGNSNYLVSSDDRLKAPADDNASALRFGFTAFNNNNASPYGDYLHMRSYADGTGGSDNFIVFRKDTFGIRQYQQTWGSTSNYATFRDVAMQQSTASFTILNVGSTYSGGSTGEIRAAGEITAYYTSDERLKENIHIISNPIERLEQIRGVEFDWTDAYLHERGGEDQFYVRKHDVGVIAQEIEKVLPEVVATRENGYKAVKYEKIVPLLIECIKQQQKQINQISQELRELSRK